MGSFTFLPIPANPLASFGFTATGGNTPRVLADRFGDLISVKDFGAIGNGAADDTAAFSAFLNFLMINMTTPRSGYVPAGVYVISAALPLITAPIGVYGAGRFRTYLSLSPSMNGDLFSTSECWAATNFNGTSVILPQRSGVTFCDFTIAASRSSGQQNAFMLYDRNDEVSIERVDVYFLNGRGFYCGSSKNVPSQAYMRESRLSDLRFFSCGNPTSPVFEISAHGNGDTTNEVDINRLDIYAPYGQGVVLRCPDDHVNGIKFDQLRIEGLQNGVTAADLLCVGDLVMAGNVNNITFDQCELIDPYTGFAAIRFTASSLATQPYQCRFSGAIGGGLPNGKGLQIDAGRNLFFDLRGMNTTGTNVTIGPNTNVGADIVIDGHGQESSYTTSIDPSSLPNVSMPVINHATFASAEPTVSGSKGGNAALASLMTALAGIGLVKDTTT